VVNGLREKDSGSPCFETLFQEHQDYVAALEKNGVSVCRLPPSLKWPDSVFVEDPALVFSQGSILLRSIVEERSGEVDLIAPFLYSTFPQVLEIDKGYVDGGDVLWAPNGVIIGLSSRTTHEGAENLVEHLSNLGLNGIITETPPGVLHLKSDCSLLDEKTIFVTPRLAGAKVFQNFEKNYYPRNRICSSEFNKSKLLSIC
jgi:dimethylargininase